MQFFNGGISCCTLSMFWTSPAAPKNMLVQHLHVPDLTWSAKKIIHRSFGWTSTGQKCEKSLFRRWPAKKKTYTAAREISENWEMRKKFIWQMACEKKYIHGPAVGILLNLRKKKHSRPARGDHGEGSGDASHEAPSPLWPLGREIF